jgi:squalene cyclase
MDNPKVILTPDGDAIVLNTILFVSTVYDNSRHTNKNWDHCYFSVYYGPQYSERRFAYAYHKYSDDHDILLSKVKNIRNELLKMLNNGIEVKEINGGINLKKDEQQ